MRFLFTTLGFHESEFYGRVTDRLREHGHDAFHIAFSRRAALRLQRKGYQAWCLPDLMDALGDVDVAAEARRIEERYPIAHLRSVYRVDWPCAGKSESWCIERTIRHFMAVERIVDELRPDVVVPEVGSETLRTAAHLVARDRGIDVLFLFYTIFPRPLRLYANTMHAPIVEQDELRELAPGERQEVEDFIAAFSARNQPIRAYRKTRVNRRTLRDFARHLIVTAVWDRDNEYIRPHRFVLGFARENARALMARGLYDQLDGSRPFVYFPLHVTDDYKIKSVIPHCVDQASIIEQVVDALPQGYDLVLKEHPMSIGRNSISMLRRLLRRPNVRLVEPYMSSHDLIRRAAAIAVISSTVGLEALLHGRPVLTLGQPFYSGYGVTVDVDSFREIQSKVPELLRFEPDREQTLRFLHAAMRRCYPGKPVLVDASQANALELADSLDRVVAGRGPDGGPLADSASLRSGGVAATGSTA